MFGTADDDDRYNDNLYGDRLFWNLPSSGTTSQQAQTSKWRRIDVDATLWRRVDVDTTSFCRCVYAGIVYYDMNNDLWTVKYDVWTVKHEYEV